MLRKIKIPDLEKMLVRPHIYASKLDNSSSYVRSNRHQEVIPKDPKLSEKLDISPKSKILVFAGFYGDWAAALAKEHNVHYTDISEQITNHVKQTHPEKIKSFRVCNAANTHEKPLEYDWSFSFEPIPLEDREWKHGTLEVALTRSLLNKFGAKIVYQQGYSGRPLNMESFAKIYSTKVSRKEVEIQANESRRKIHVVTLFTNVSARRKAFIDLKIMHELSQNPPKRKSELLQRDPIKTLEVTTDELGQSLHRLNELSKLMKNHREIKFEE